MSLIRFALVSILFSLFVYPAVSATDWIDEYNQSKYGQVQPDQSEQPPLSYLERFKVFAKNQKLESIMSLNDRIFNRHGMDVYCDLTDNGVSPDLCVEILQWVLSVDFFNGLGRTQKLRGFFISSTTEIPEQYQMAWSEEMDIYGHMWLAPGITLQQVKQLMAKRAQKLQELWLAQYKLEQRVMRLRLSHNRKLGTGILHQHCSYDLSLEECTQAFSRLAEASDNVLEQFDTHITHVLVNNLEGSDKVSTMHMGTFSTDALVVGTQFFLKDVKQALHIQQTPN